MIKMFDRGLFKALSAFVGLIDENELLEIVEMKPLTMGEKNLYLNYGLTLDNLETDINNQVYLVGIKNTASDIVYLPSTYIESNIFNGVYYQRQLLGLAFDGLPKDEDISDVINDIITLVKNRLGIDPVKRLAPLSKVVKIPTIQSETIQNDRLQMRNDNTNYKTKYENLLLAHNRLTTEYNKLKNYAITQANP